jgi:hypothetical protein
MLYHAWPAVLPTGSLHWLIKHLRDGLRRVINTKK